MPLIEWATLDGVTMHYANEHGTVLREELDRRIVQNSLGWAVILSVYRERKKVSDEFGEIRFSIEKWVKRRGMWRPQARLRLSFQNMVDVQELANEWIVDADEGDDTVVESVDEDRDVEDEGDDATAVA